MSTAMPNRLTRTQVQEKLKRNFQALCTKCPQLGKTQETLDDSLTSLQWLSNLNVNISNPRALNSKAKHHQRADSLISAFPSNLTNGRESSSTLAVKNGINLNTIQSKSTSKRSSYNTSSASRGLGRVARKASAPVGGTTQQFRSFRADASSADPQKLQRRALSLSSEEAVQLSSSRLGNGMDILFQPDSSVDLNDLLSTGITGESKRGLPKIRALSKLDDSDDIHVSPESSARNYSFSPTQATLDILPGQVDYKNNRYVKPAFSFTTLIYMAMQNNKRNRLTFSDICKWIMDNFIYYRYADPEWKNSLKLQLMQSKHFCKVQKKDGSFKACSWQVNPGYNSPDVLSTLIKDNLSSEISFHIPVVDCVSATSLSALSETDPDEFIRDALQCRKRKQTSPQKVIRRRSTKKRREGRSTKSVNNQNLLQEQAPELGSLKGEFNWNSIFEDFFSSREAQLSITPTSLASRSSGRTEKGGATDANEQFSEDITSSAFIAQNEMILPHITKATVNDENRHNSSSYTPATTNTALKSTWTSSIDHNLSTSAINCEASAENLSSSSSNLPPIGDFGGELKDCDTDFDSIDVFLKDVGELDLTVTGKQIEPPPEWITECADLDAILCEKQNDIMFEEVSYSHVNLNPVAPSLSNFSSNDQYHSRENSGSHNRRHRRSGVRRNQDSPVIAFVQQRRPWQDIKDQSEAIENLLSTTF